jgi:hypothetical protein
MTFQVLFPGLADFVASTPKIWPFSLLRDHYALFGAFHLVGLALMGGPLLLLNLRLMGMNPTGQTLPEIEKSTRPWLIAGLGIVLGSGVVIGMLNSVRIYNSVPFFAKITALVAACIYSFGVSNAIAKADGKASRNVVIAGVIAFLLWLVALGVLFNDQIAQAGLFHPIMGGYAILVIYGLRTRWIAGITFLLLFGGEFIMYSIVGFNSMEPIYSTISQIITTIAGLTMIVLFGVEVYLGRAESATPTARLVALFTVLCWITVAAGGRWIGFA